MGNILEKASTRITRIKRALRSNENSQGSGGSTQWSMDHLPDPEEDPETYVLIIQDWSKNQLKELQLLETAILREYQDVCSWEGDFSNKNLNILPQNYYSDIVQNCLILTN